MNKYDGLLLRIAQRYGIQRGKNENDNEWKVRIIYSICGLMAYSSLWDDISEEAVSIIHLKQRIRSVYDSYIELYSEVSSYFPSDKESLEKEIARIYQNSGMVYHRPNRIFLAQKSFAKVGNVCFQRGIGIDNIQNVSGLGFFSKNAKNEAMLSIQKMFVLDEDSLPVFWKKTLDNANWTLSNGLQSNTEYLKMEPPFTRGYWVNKPYKNGQISLLRTGFPDSQLYYLYRFKNNFFELSPLPEWSVEEHQYRSIACACLHSIGVLPCTDYTIDGDLVHMHMNYLLPPRELNWIKLFTWPENCYAFPSDFYRKCSFDVFSAFNQILSEKGYSFIER